MDRTESWRAGELESWQREMAANPACLSCRLVSHHIDCYFRPVQSSPVHLGVDIYNYKRETVNNQ